MSRSRRVKIEGRPSFFAIAPADRRNDLSVRHIEHLRCEGIGRKPRRMTRGHGASRLSPPYGCFSESKIYRQTIVCLEIRWMGIRARESGREAAIGGSKKTRRINAQSFPIDKAAPRTKSRRRFARLRAYSGCDPEGGAKRGACVRFRRLHSGGFGPCSSGITTGPRGASLQGSGQSAPCLRTRSPKLSQA
jgi:hypothetical protein